MADRQKRKVEFIESYWTGGELGSDYRWNDNHGELVRCIDCKHYEDETGICDLYHAHGYAETWFCADGERAENGNV